MRHALYVLPLIVAGAVETASAQLVPNPLSDRDRVVITERYYYPSPRVAASQFSYDGVAPAQFEGAAATQPTLAPVPEQAPVTSYGTGCNCPCSVTTVGSPILSSGSSPCAAYGSPYASYRAGYVPVGSPYATYRAGYVPGGSPYATYRATAAPARPGFPAGAPAGQYVGRGLIGQPKLYVSGQPLRNVLRFLSF